MCLTSYQRHIASIATESVSSTLSAKMHEFEKSKMEDTLNRKLANRPTRERMLEMNLLRAQGMSPELYTRRQELAKTILEDKLNKKLAARPTKESLVESRMLKGTFSKLWVMFLINCFSSFGRGRSDQGGRSREPPASIHSAESQLGAVGQVRQPVLVWGRTSRKHQRWFSFSSNDAHHFFFKLHEAAPLLQSWTKRRDSGDFDGLIADDASSGSSDAASSSALASDGLIMPPPAAPSPPPPSASPLGSMGSEARPAPHKLVKLLSSQSIKAKSAFIRELQEEGRFVCVNCCSEDFQGLELSSPRYSYKDFYEEAEWKEIGLRMPKHHPEAKAKRSSYFVLFYHWISSFMSQFV